MAYVDFHEQAFTNGVFSIQRWTKPWVWMGGFINNAGCLYALSESLRLFLKNTPYAFCFHQLQDRNMLQMRNSHSDLLCFCA
ncbi:hypothetical protein MRB53_014077 [Persea americana]|uniref:Uncharacterized protein n=1 Tax=Persea americana TaxID=3435 RepID=A0ACC2K9Y3_PERAE|nr:hypothetical protein MRB53_014077 [Persea americana]